MSPRRSVLLLALVLAAGGASLLPAASGSSAGGCRIDDTRLSFGPRWSPGTGQNPVTVVLRSRLPRSCALDGYPALALLDEHGRLLRFRYSHAGDQMITRKKPSPVLVGPGGSAFFAFNKFRCDMGVVAAASIVRVALPGSRETRSLRLGGRAVIDYCRPGIPVANVVVVSPIVPRLTDASASH